jgi:hypothetical protein
LEGLRLKNVDVFFVHLKYVTDIWYIFSGFGTFLPFFCIVNEAKSGSRG